MISTKGLKPWFMERFPPMNFVSGFFMYILPKSLASLYSQHQGHGFLSWNNLDLLAAFIPALHLLILRVFDEHKDYESDKINNPHRPLQKGVVSLKQIQFVGWISFILQILFFLALNPNQELFILYAGVWIWTLLMWKEFFIQEWLKKNYLAYALLHMLITPAILLLSLRLSKATYDFDVDIILLGFLTSWIYEVSRKTKAPSEETGDASYSKLWGLKISCLIIGIQGLATLIVGAHLFQIIGIMNLSCLIIFCILLALHFISLFKFLSSPSPKARKSNEGTSALIGLSIFIIPLIFLLTA